MLTWSNQRPDLYVQLQRLDSNSPFWRTVWPGISSQWSAPHQSSAADAGVDYYHGRKRYEYRPLVKTAAGYTSFSNIARA